MTGLGMALPSDTTERADGVFRTMAGDQIGAVQLLPSFLQALASPKTGLAYVDDAVDALAHLLGATSVFVAHRLSKDTKEVRVLAARRDGQPREPWTYSLEGQPCLITYAGEPTLIPCDLFRDYPAKGELGYKSFVGVPLRGLSGAVFGHLALYDRDALVDDGTFNMAIAQAFASRIASEVERHLELEHLARIAETCPMTGLLNRRGFETRAASALQRLGSSSAILSAITFDLDRFKQINDVHGHASGDHMLVAFGSCLSACFHRRSDYAARLGGDEFIVLSENQDIGQVMRMGERVRSMFEACPVITSQGPVYGTCSFGAATLQIGESLDAALNRADAALYASKRERRARQSA